MITHEAALAVQLEFEAVPAEQLVAGAPTTAVAEFGEFDGCEYGVWEMTEGAMSDVEESELFIVVKGAGTVRFDSGETIELGPGSVGRLDAGERTVWTVTSALRKIYITARS
ncbi:MAG: cupin domain-containing protein [Microbacteriaceae bacterium]